MYTASIIYSLVTSILLVFLVGMLGYVIWRMRMQLEKLSRESTSLNKQLAAITVASKGFSQCVKELEGSVQFTAQQQLKMDMHSHGAYKQAARMVEMGADTDDLVATCHLSKAEAELLINLHGYKQAAKKIPA